MIRWLPDTIAARIALTILLSWGVFQLVGIGLLYIEFGRAGVPNNLAEYMVPARIAVITRIVDAASPLDRPSIVAGFDKPPFGVAIRDTRLVDVEAEKAPRFRELRLRVLAGLDEPDRPVIVGKRRQRSAGAAGQAPGPAPLEGDALLIQVALADGHWLVFTTAGDYPREFRFFRKIGGAAAVFSLVVGLLSILAARRLAAPIAAFAGAAERLGVDSRAPPLAERGPRELRGATRAFNRMQERLRRFVDDRTQMLAAMSHDLRTPLARLRLRAEFIEDEEQQRKMLADLDAMSAMVESTLAFARDDAQRDPRMLVDLGVVLADLCEDAADTGGAVAFSGSRGVDVVCRPTAVRRAVVNLVENAVKYGGAARVHVVRGRDRVVIVVDDDGPGIPEEEREKVFAPFYRLEHSRNRDTGGIGLGLAVARTIAREHGGDIALENRAGGGLRVRMELPDIGQEARSGDGFQGPDPIEPGDERGAGAEASMSHASCPTAVVNAPVGVVWTLLTQPARWGDFFDLRITGVDPAGPAAVGQRFYGESGPRILHLKLAFQYVEIDEPGHRLVLNARLPFGITVREDLDCLPLAADRCRVNYRCGFGFPKGWRGAIARAVMGRWLDAGPADSLSRLKRAAERLHANPGR